MQSFPYVDDFIRVSLIVRIYVDDYDRDPMSHTEFREIKDLADGKGPPEGSSTKQEL